jgi:hypothetical protein
VIAVLVTCQAERLMLDVAGGTRSEHEVADLLTPCTRPIP